MNRTSGSYPTEADSAAEFDRIVGASGMFRVYREVDGYYLAHRPGHELRCPRIDRILQPLPALRERGWTATVGVELKRSGTKLGPLVSQALDYSWAIFRCGDTYLYPEGIFVWPMRRDEGDGDETVGRAIESVMVQNKIGTCCAERGDTVAFFLGSSRVLGIGAAGASVVRADLFNPVGRKTGSR